MAALGQEKQYINIINTEISQVKKQLVSLKTNPDSPVLPSISFLICFKVLDFLYSFKIALSNISRLSEVVFYAFLLIFVSFKHK